MKIDLSDLIVLSFASFGLTYLIRYTDGPGDIFRRVRILFGFNYVEELDDNDEVIDYMEEGDDSFFYKLMDCFWCLTTWVSAAIVILYYVVPNAFPLFVWLALIGVSGLLHNMSEV